jgi:hypothetical protein
MPTPESEKNLKVAVGTHVRAELMTKSGAKEQVEFDLVPEGQGDFERGFLAVETPLARAILDQPAGSTLPYKMGDIVEVHLSDVTASVIVPPADTAEKRQAVIRKVVDKSDLANAISYALAAENKWGDYDPEGIASNWSEQSKPDDQSGDEKAKS